MNEIAERLLSALYFSILAAATIYVITESAVFSPLRVLIRNRRSLWLTVLIYCPACIGFWTGFTLYWAGWAEWTSRVPKFPAFVAGCAGLLIGLRLKTWVDFQAFQNESRRDDNGETQARTPEN